MSKIFILSLLIIALFFSSCSRKSRYYYSKPTPNPQTYSSSKSDYAPTLNAKQYKYAKMNPYVVMGVKYYPREVSVGEKYSGYASWYGPDFHGKNTANGEKYNMYDNTAAHKTFPMNTVLKVTNRNNGLSTIVRINDRGPFKGTRIIDLSNTAAKKINMLGSGTAPVVVEVLGYYSKNKLTYTPPKDKVITYTPPKNKEYTKQDKSAKNQYALQIASFTNIEGAIKIQEKFNGIDGYKTIIKDIQNDDGRVFKVYLKGFKSEKEIRKYKSNSDFSNAFIVKY